ncbi:MAG: HD domain-containing protein [Deltaproteobacteria bacterium]|nr:HD domain-containing protein [Deltaproteobacteria bacterium]
MMTDLQKGLKIRERQFLGKRACQSVDAVRRHGERLQDYRLDFSIDADRIMHSKAYTRYIDKTQVFYMVANDHITHRVLHVQLVSKIARTIGRFLGLNEDLIEAIALGHDIGHPPFGHDGESFLAEICRRHGLSSFRHNVQSVRFLDCIEKKGRGLNLTMQTLDGILCHDGEIHQQQLTPDREKNFADFDRQCRRKEEETDLEIRPATLEGCVVRMADTIAYIGRDIEDAIELNLIRRHDLPELAVKTLGNSNGTIVYKLVTDLITHSYQHDYIGFSTEISEALKELKKFNYQKIYLSPKIKSGVENIKFCYQKLFDNYLGHFTSRHNSTEIFEEFISHLGPERIADTSPAGIVRDFIAGMTDDYFMAQAQLIGCSTK